MRNWSPAPSRLPAEPTCVDCWAALHEDRYQRVQDFIDSCSEVERQVAILRLMRMDNDGERHFDHGSEHAPALGYSWACLACQQMGRGGLNGWVGAFEMMAEVAQHIDGSGEGG